MNPLLSKLQPYPFERLRKLFADVTPNPAYPAISLGISLILNNITAILALFGQSGAASSLLNGGSAGGAYYGYGDAAASTVISIVPPWLLLLALCFATLIGLLSGIAPANRAVRISALEAIRHD